MGVGRHGTWRAKRANLATWVSSARRLALHLSYLSMPHRALGCHGRALQGKNLTRARTYSEDIISSLFTLLTIDI